MTQFAFCGADGAVFFGPQVLSGMLCIAKMPVGPRVEDWRSDIEGLCRRAYGDDNPAALVPGLPEANGQFEALDALFDFRRLLQERGLDATPVATLEKRAVRGKVKSRARDASR